MTLPAPGVPEARRGGRAARWGWTIGGLALTGVALVITFVLSFGTAGESFYEREFAWLFWINVAVAALLLGVVVYVLTRLVSRVRAGRFGSRLLIKLAGILALVGVLPGAVIYTVSWQFAERSIESWFDLRVARALDAGVALGRDTLDTLKSDFAAKIGVGARRLAEATDSPGPLALERLREQLGAEELSLVDATGQLLTSAVAGRSALTVERPSPRLLRQAREASVASQIDGLEDGSTAARIRVLAALPSNEIALRPAEARFLWATQALPPALAANALAVQAAYSEYQQRALAREALRRMYLGTLTLALVLAVFGGVLLAIVLGNQITRPLLLLADGVREVAAGNLQARPVFPSADELGGLTRSFADMTQQVADARTQVERGMRQLESARTGLQTILDNLTTGVIVLDRAGRVDAANPGAARILRRAQDDFAGRTLAEVAPHAGFAAAVQERFEAMAADAEPAERERWQDSFTLDNPASGGATLLVRGALLPGEQRLLVFDDITDVVSAQRAQAWAEVARRMAHEIKNPLTPIQLSAERLQLKLEPRLQGADQAMLVRSVATIVDQVEAMKRLVNEFRDYARLPSAQPVPLALNRLVADVLALYGQVQEQGRLVARPGEGLPDILGDAAQLRQVVHNLVQNALDAVAERPEGRVMLRTEAARGDDGQPTAVRLIVEDNGAGFDERVLQRAFEPYMTTKPRGTGLGLALVKKIADEHRARVALRNRHAEDRPENPVTGARVSISFFALVAAAREPAAQPA
jgi:nitrogen fixation/metabolism regulation signal transduction histidine kinase